MKYKLIFAFKEKSLDCIIDDFREVIAIYNNIQKFKRRKFGDTTYTLTGPSGKEGQLGENGFIFDTKDLLYFTWEKFTEKENENE